MTKRILMIGWNTEDAIAFAEAVGWHINRPKRTFVTQIDDIIIYLEGIKASDIKALREQEFDIILRGPLTLNEAVWNEIYGRLGFQLTTRL